MKRKHKALSTTKAAQLSALHTKRVSTTEVEFCAAIVRMSMGQTRLLSPPIRWTLGNLAIEASRNVATLHRKLPGSSIKIFENVLHKFRAAQKASLSSFTSNTAIVSERKKRQTAETETKNKEDELAKLLEQNLELAYQLRLLERVQSFYEKAEEEVRQLRVENGKLKEQILAIKFNHHQTDCVKP